MLFEYLLRTLYPYGPTNSLSVHRLMKLALGIELVNSGAKPVFLANEKMGTYFQLNDDTQNTIRNICPNIMLDTIHDFVEKVIAIRHCSVPPVTKETMQNGYLLGYLTPYESPIWDEYHQDPSNYQLYYISYDLVPPNLSGSILEPQFLVEIVVRPKSDELVKDELSISKKFTELTPKIYPYKPTINCVPIKSLEQASPQFYRNWLKCQF